MPVRRLQPGELGNRRSTGTTVAGAALSANTNRYSQGLNGARRRPPATPLRRVGGIDPIERPLVVQGSADPIALAPLGSKTPLLQAPGDSLKGRFPNTIPGERALVNADLATYGTGLPVGDPSLEVSNDLSVFVDEGSVEFLEEAEEEIISWKGRLSSGLGNSPATAGPSLCLNFSVVRPEPESKDDDENNDEGQSGQDLPSEESPVTTGNEDPCKGANNDNFWVLNPTATPAGGAPVDVVTFGNGESAVLYSDDGTADRSQDAGCDWQTSTSFSCIGGTCTEVVGDGGEFPTIEECQASCSVAQEQDTCFIYSQTQTVTPLLSTGDDSLQVTTRTGPNGVYFTETSAGPPRTASFWGSVTSRQWEAGLTTRVISYLVVADANAEPPSFASPDASYVDESSNPPLNTRATALQNLQTEIASCCASNGGGADCNQSEDDIDGILTAMGDVMV